MKSKKPLNAFAGCFSYQCLCFSSLQHSADIGLAAVRLSPVDKVSEAARTISIESLAARLPVPETGDEIERLSRTFNDLLARLQGSVERMTQFTADASHELRAPTTLIRTTAEMALRRLRSVDEYQQALGQVLTESERMSHLVDSLLLLARADSGSDGSGTLRFDLTTSVNEACEEGRTLAASRDIELTMRISTRLQSKSLATAVCQETVFHI